MILKIVIFVLLNLSFIVIFFLKEGLNKTKVSEMKCSTPNSVSEAEAQSDWQNYYIDGTSTHLTGALNCFCNALVDE